MNLGEIFETSMVAPLGILVALVRRQICQVSYNSGKLVGRPSVSPFIIICLVLDIETRTKRL